MQLTAATATPGVTYLDQKSLKVTVVGPDPAGSAKIQAKGVSGVPILLVPGYPLSPLPGAAPVTTTPVAPPTRVSTIAGKPRDVLEPMLPDLSDAELETLGADDTRHWVGHEILKEIDRRAAKAVETPARKITAEEFARPALPLLQAMADRVAEQPPEPPAQAARYPGTEAALREVDDSTGALISDFPASLTLPDLRARFPGVSSTATLAYLEGIAAFHDAGDDEPANPYGDEDERAEEWLDGWMEAPRVEDVADARESGRTLLPWERAKLASKQTSTPVETIPSPSVSDAHVPPAGDTAPSLAYLAGREAFACPFYLSLAEAEEDPSNRDFDTEAFVAGWMDAKRGASPVRSEMEPTAHPVSAGDEFLKDDGPAAGAGPIDVGGVDHVREALLADVTILAQGGAPGMMPNLPPVVGPATTRDPRGYCLACGKDVAVKKDGTAREHKARAATAPGPCAGSGRAALDHRPTTQEMAEATNTHAALTTAAEKAMPTTTPQDAVASPAGDNVASATDDQVLEWIVEAHQMMVGGRGSHGELEALIAKAVAARPRLAPTAAPVLAVLRSGQVSGDGWDRVEQGLVSLRALARVREGHVAHGVATPDTDIDTDQDDPDKIHAPAVSVEESADNADNKSPTPTTPAPLSSADTEALVKLGGRVETILAMDPDDARRYLTAGLGPRVPLLVAPSLSDLPALGLFAYRKMGAEAAVHGLPRETALEGPIPQAEFFAGYESVPGGGIAMKTPLRSTSQEPPVPTASPVPDPLADLYHFLLVRMNVAGDDREIAEAWPQDAVDKVLALTGTVRENSTALVGCYDREVIAAALDYEESGKARATILDKLRERLKQIDVGAAKAPASSAPSPEASPASAPSKPVYVKIPAVSETDRSRATTVSHHLAIVAECLPFALALRASLDSLREAGVVLDVGIELKVGGRS